jgi:hypothetical protein
MAHLYEPAPTGRSKCRGCGKPIAKDEIRFGESMPSSFGEGEMTLWFHPLCAAYKRPEAILESLAEAPEAERATLERIAQAGTAQERVPRVDGAERAASSQAKCRCCRQPIPKGTWRIRLVFFEDGRFMPGGFIHLGCRGSYFEGQDVEERMLRFSPDLTDEDREDLLRAYRSEPLRTEPCEAATEAGSSG